MFVTKLSRRHLLQLNPGNRIFKKHHGHLNLQCFSFKGYKYIIIQVKLINIHRHMRFFRILTCQMLRLKCWCLWSDFINSIERLNHEWLHSSDLPLTHRACFFACVPCSATLHCVTLCEIWAAFRNLMAIVHVVAMVIITLKGCREATFVLLNGCKEWQNACGRLAWRMFDQVLICFLCLQLIVLNEDKLLRTRLLCIISPRVRPFHGHGQGFHYLWMLQH